MTDLIDERLRAYGARWRETLPEPTEPGPVPVVPSTARWWLVPAAAAAVLAVVLGVTYTVTGGDDVPAPADRTPTDPVDGVVAWAPLAPTRPQLPTTRGGPAPDLERSPYQRLMVAADREIAVEVGEDVEFEVTLTSPVDIVLDPCPDYELLVGPREERFALNCGEVPYRDDTGRPVLPAGRPVTFAMRTDAFQEAVYVEKVVWQLDAPGRPHVPLTLTVGRPSITADATVAGVVTMDGGPGGASSKVTRGEVRAMGDGSVWATAPIGLDGSFELTVPAGTWRIVAVSPDYLSSGAECSAGVVTVDFGEHASVSVSCPVR